MKLFSLVSFIAIILSYSLCAGQTDKQKDSIQLVILDGGSLRNSGKYIESNELLHLAYDNSKKNQYLEQALEATWLIGSNHFVMGEYDSANFYFSKILNDRKSEIDSDSIIAMTLGQKGTTMMKMNHYDSAKIYYDSANAAYINEFGKNSLLHANVIEMEGSLAFRLSDLGSALEFFKIALEIRKKFLDKDSYNVSQSYFNVGVAYGQMRDYINARSNFKETLRIREKILDENHPSLGMLYNSIGICHREENNLKEAVFYYQKARGIYENLDYESGRLFNVYKNIGNVYNSTEKYDSAQSYYLKSLKSAERKYGKKNINVSQVFNAMGMSYDVQGKNSLAAASYHNALLASILHETDSNVYFTPPLPNAILGRDITLAAIGKAKSMHHLYNKNKNEKDLLASYQSYELGVELIDQFLERGISDEYILHLLDSMSKFNQQIVSLSTELFNISKDDKHIYEAYKLVNSNRSRLLNFNTKEATAKKFSQIPDSIREYELDIRKTLALNKSQLLIEQKKSKPDSIRISDIERARFDAQQSQRQIIKYLEENYPAYLRLKYDREKIDAKRLQKNLLNEEQLIQYIYGDSIIYAFIISSNNFDMVKIGTSNGIDTLIQKYNKSIIDNDIGSFKRVSFLLYQKLFEPISEKITKQHLIVIPDGAIWRVNFDLLITENNENRTFNHLPYLLRRYTISYNYSPHSINGSMQKTVRKRDKGLLAFSYGEVDDANGGLLSLQRLRNQNVELPGSRREIKEISSFIDGEYFYGKTANEHAFRENVTDYSMLHLALHGQIDFDDPDNSFLSFYSKSDSVEDGRLHVFELYSMNINADLAVLSACNTGAGQVSKGEGVMSLGRAFANAGVKSLLLTQWQVSDATTPQIMNNFYSELKKGKRKSEALRNAKLNYLSSADNLSSAPFYWGSFYLLGDNQPIEFTRGRTHIYLGMEIILLILLLIVFRIGGKNPPKYHEI